MSLQTIEAKGSSLDHIWKGFIEEISCDFNIYLLDYLDGTHNIIVLCDSGVAPTTQYEISKFNLIIDTTELETLIADGSLVKKLIDRYLSLNLSVRYNFNATVH